MAAQIDTTQLFALDVRLTQVGRVFDKTLMGQTLKDALKPTLDAAKQEVPVGQTSRKSSLTFRTRRGKSRRDGTYDKGGATKRDLRIRIVPGVQDEIVRGLVGVSKSRGKVGWRTHLITRKNLHRSAPNDFLARAEQKTSGLVVANMQASAEKIVTKTVLRG